MRGFTLPHGEGACDGVRAGVLLAVLGESPSSAEKAALNFGAVPQHHKDHSLPFSWLTSPEEEYRD